MQDFSKTADSVQRECLRKPRTACNSVHSVYCSCYGSNEGRNDDIETIPADYVWFKFFPAKRNGHRWWR